VLAVTAVRAVHFAVAVQIVGALLFVAMMGRVPELAADRQRRYWLRAAAVLAIVAFPSAFAWLLAQAAEMTGRSPIEAWNAGAVGLLLLETHAGLVWWARFGIAAALAIVVGVLACRGGRPSEAALAVALVLAVAGFVSCAWLSHAASDGSRYGAIHLAAQALHMVGVALWLGGLAPFAMLLPRSFRSGDGDTATAVGAIAARFGDIALLAVGVIVTSGVITAALAVREPAELTTGPYAGLLAVKLGLFGVMLVLAGVNRRRLVPRLAGAEHGSVATRLRRSVIGELVLGSVILVIASALGVTPPGTDE
jgi:putative copper resistance protein D